MTNTPSNNDLALAACPFCGSDASTVEDDGRFYVACRGLECFCAVGEDYDGYAMPNHSFYEEEAAIKAWNTRTSPPESATPPAGGPVGDFYLVPREIIDQFPEINVNNYDHDDACALNAWGCEVVTNTNPSDFPLYAAPQPQEPACREALENILHANDEFRASLPDGWEGDPLNDACIEARAALSSPVSRTASPGGDGILTHLERALSQYDKTIDRAKGDEALSDSGRESIIRDCLAAKAAIRSFAPALSALSVSVTAGREWQDIGMAPKDGTPLLFCNWTGPEQDVLPITSGFWSRISEAWYSEMSGQKIRPTHWQPLLAPPSIPGSSS